MTYANDLGKDMNSIRRKTSFDQFGFYRKSSARDIVITLPGIEGILQWIQDAYVPDYVLPVDQQPWK